MAKKEKKSGLGRGLDSLIPKIEEKEVEEGISLEDIQKSKMANEKKETIIEEVLENKEEESEETIFEEEPVDEEKELIFTEDDFNDDEIPVEEEEVEKYEEEIDEEEVDEELIEKSNESSSYTNVFFNDDAIIDEKIKTENDIKNIDSSIDLNEKSSESIEIIEAGDNINEVTSLLSEKEEKLIDEVIETVENNPRITLWSARSAAVLRFLRKTEPEFSISNEASNLIDAAIAEKYPEIWTLFNHL